MDEVQTSVLSLGRLTLEVSEANVTVRYMKKKNPGNKGK